MFFSPKKLLLAASLLFAGIASADDCDSGPWTDVLSIGGQDGDRFCATKWVDGKVITGVEVWANGKYVKGVQFYYSDGSNSDLVGATDSDKHARMDWDPAVDGISQVKLWGNGNGKYTGRIYVRTKKGAELDVGKDTNGQKTYDITTNSGILLGAFGAASKDVINSFGFLFLKSEVDQVKIGDVVFKEDPDALNAKMEGIKVKTLDYADHTNAHPDANETFTFGRTETQSTSKKWSNTATNTFGFQQATEISGKILELGAKSTTTLSYQYAKANTEESSQESSVTLTYTVATMLKPNQRVFCRATAWYGEYNGEYTSTVSIWLKDGTTFAFASEGKMDQIQWSQASSECRDTDFPPVDENAPPQTKRAIKWLA